MATMVKSRLLTQDGSVKKTLELELNIQVHALSIVNVFTVLVLIVLDQHVYGWRVCGLAFTSIKIFPLVSTIPHAHAWSLVGVIENL